jgi:hypothetical protein
MKNEYGTDQSAFVYVFDDNHFGKQHLLMNPLRDSLNAFLNDLPNDTKLMHVSVDFTEDITFKCALEEAFWRTYVQTLKENNIDLRVELRQASCLSSDEMAREYLGNLNLHLRKHLENFPTHYNNPVRLPGQGGRLRGPKNIPPIDVNWP